MRRGPALAENFLMTGGPPVTPPHLLRLRFFSFFGSPGCCGGGCDIVNAGGYSVPLSVGVSVDCTFESAKRRSRGVLELNRSTPLEAPLAPS